MVVPTICSTSAAKGKLIRQKEYKIMTHKEKALQLFADKFHCSQAVLAAFAGECGITEEQALKLGTAHLSFSHAGAKAGAKL